MGRRKEKHSRKAGFTLVELVVVLVILAILMAILVPSLIGYIQKAKVQQAFAECRNCVIAAQSIASEKYGKDKELEWGDEYADVLKLAEAPGKINEEIQTNEQKYQITYLAYTTGKLTVIYEKGHDPEYYLADGSLVGAAEKDVSVLSGYAGYVAGITEWTKSDRWTATKDWMDKEDIKELPSVSKSILEKAGVDTPLYWRPYYIGNKGSGQIVYYANSNPGKDAAGNWTNQNQWNASIVLINGKLYKYTGPKTDGGMISGWGAGNNVTDYQSAANYILDAKQGFVELK